MSENKNFKAFRNELSESEYKETLTGHPNRGIDTDVGGVKHDSDTLQKINGVLAALGRYTYQNAAEAMIKIRTRLNLFMIDFPWTPWMWQSNPTGTFTLGATLYGRVDGVDALTGGIRTDGKANPNSGMKEFALVVTVEPAEDGFYRVNAVLQPQIAVVPESVENIGDSVEEDVKIGEGTDWKSLKKTKANLDAIRASGKRVITQHGEGDTIYKVLPAKRSVKPVKSVKEAAEPIDEAGSAKLARMGRAYDKARIGARGVLNPERTKQMGDAYFKQRDKVHTKRAKRIAAGTFDKERELEAHRNRRVIEALIGGQKRLDVNKNKRLDSQDFKLLRAKKKPVQEEQKKPWWMTSTAAELAAAAQSASNARRGEEAESRKRHAQQNRRMKWTLARKQAPSQIPEGFDSPSRFTIDEGAGPPPSKSQLKKSIAWLQSLLKDPKKLAKSGLDVQDAKDNLAAAEDMLDFANKKYRS